MHGLCLMLVLESRQHKPQRRHIQTPLLPLMLLLMLALLLMLPFIVSRTIHPTAALHSTAMLVDSANTSLLSGSASSNCRTRPLLQHPKLGHQRPVQGQSAGSQCLHRLRLASPEDCLAGTSL